MAGQVLIAREVSALSELITLCEGASFGEVLPRQVLEHLGALLEAEVVEISGLNPVVQVAYLCGPDDGDCHRAPTCTYPAGSGDEIEQPFWRHYWFTESRNFTGMAYQLCVELDVGGGRNVRLTCQRADGSDFDGRCRTLLRLLKPHLERACAAVPAAKVQSAPRPRVTAPGSR